MRAATVKMQRFCLRRRTNSHGTQVVPWLPHRNFLLQFFEPVEDDIDLRGRGGFGFDWLQHQEALAVGGESEPRV